MASDNDRDHREYERKELHRSQSHRLFINAHRQRPVEGETGESSTRHRQRSREDIRRSSIQESSSYEFSTDDDDSFDYPGSSGPRSRSASRLRIPRYRRSSSANDEWVDEWVAEGDARERSGRLRQRMARESRGPTRHEPSSSEYLSRPNIEAKHRYSTGGVFLAPPDIDQYAGRPRSVEPGRPNPTFLRSHRSTERFEGLDERPRNLVHVDDRVRGSVLAFGDLAQTSRGKEGLDSAADTDLTFRKIANIAEDAQYRLKAWSLAVQLTDASGLAPGDADTLNVMHGNFSTLQKLTGELNAMCSRASPADLVVRPGDSEAYIEYLIDRSGPSHAKYGPHRDPVGFRIQEKLSAIEAGIQNIELLATPIKESFEPNLQQSLRKKVVQDAERYFGSEEKLRRYPVSSGLTGEEALRMAKATYLVADTPTPQRKAVTYLKVHQRDLDVQTLDFYKLRWEKDKENPDFIIILEDSTTYQIELLFEHTRRLRARRQSEPDPELRYVWVRRQSRSRSREPPKRDSRIKD